jgi:hypothetical protein
MSNTTNQGYNQNPVAFSVMGKNNQLLSATHKFMELFSLTDLSGHWLDEIPEQQSQKIFSEILSFRKHKRNTHNFQINSLSKKYKILISLTFINSEALETDIIGIQCEKIISEKKDITKNMFQPEVPFVFLKNILTNIHHDLTSGINNSKLLLEWIEKDSSKETNPYQSENFKLLKSTVSSSSTILERLLTLSQLCKSNNETGQINLKSLSEKLQFINDHHSTIELRALDTNIYTQVHYFETLLSHLFQFSLASSQDKEPKIKIDCSYDQVSHSLIYTDFSIQNEFEAINSILESSSFFFKNKYFHICFAKLAAELLSGRIDLRYTTNPNIFSITFTFTSEPKEVLQ